MQEFGYFHNFRINSKVVHLVYVDKLIYEYIYFQKAVDSLLTGYGVCNEIDVGTL